MTQQNPHELHSQRKRLSRGVHFQRLVRPQVVVEMYPVADRQAGMLDCFVAMAMHVLLFYGPDYALDHIILLVV